MSLFLCFKVSATLIISMAMAGVSVAAEKQRIEKESDLPRFSYKISEPLEKIVKDKTLFAKTTVKIRADMEGVLEKYEIADKASHRQYLESLMLLDFLLENYDEALVKSEKVRALEEKPADKLLAALRLRAMVAAVKKTGSLNTPEYFELVKQFIDKEISAYSYTVIANDIKSMKASAEVIGEGRLLGGVKDVLQKTVDKNGGNLSSDLAEVLINVRYSLETALPLKKTLIATYGAYLDRNKIEKADIWAARNIALSATGNYQPVNVAVWDSGVDGKLFPKQLLTDASGKLASIAFDLESKPSKDALYPIPKGLTKELPMLLSRTKGFSDLQSNVDSSEASEVKQLLSSLKSEQFQPTMEQLGLVGNFVHGTHVAGIAVDGNPWARLVNARISFDYKLQPNPCPSLALSKRGALAHQAYVDFFKKNKVRVVNMSWGGSVKGGESSLESCGIGKTTEERQKLARTYFEIEKKALIKAFSSAPEILFITAAGNSNSDSSFGEFIPSSIVLPNLLTVGAVDKAGDEAPFTSYGPTVKVHANGYQVESYLPGGSRVALSGTSMASPNVANLAAKILAVKPSLKPQEVIDIIQDTAEETSDGRRKLINPIKAVQKL
ncbi:MAG: S8 family serine peptidase [Betaproteobacteria bacterium]